MRDKKSIILLVGALLLTTGITADEGTKLVTQSTPAFEVRDPVIYTIQGTKDPRLQATFFATYVSSSKSKICSYNNPTTGTRKVEVGNKQFAVTEENYRIEIPIFLPESENGCGYRFSRIELMLRRLYDNDLYSRHILLDRTSRVNAIYHGDKTGIRGGGGHPMMPGTLMTDKRYFRIAKKTQYICRTQWYPKLKNRTSLYCFMQIKDGKGDNQFIRPTALSRVTHPEFGADEIKNEVLQVDILADDLGSKAYTGKEVLQDYFRTLPAPKPSRWEKFKNRLGHWLERWL